MKAGDGFNRMWADRMWLMVVVFMAVGIAAPSVILLFLAAAAAFVGLFCED